MAVQYHLMQYILLFDVIDQTRGRVFHQDIQTPRSVLKNEAVDIEADETLFRVFDLASQTNQYLKRKLR